MPSLPRRGRVRLWTWLARYTLRPIGRVCWMLLAAMAGALGGPPPRFLRHEDETAEVAQERERVP